MTYNDAILELVKIQDTMMVDRYDNKRIDVKIKPLYTRDRLVYYWCKVNHYGTCG